MAGILVTDDDALRRCLKPALEEADHPVEDAVNGELGSTRFRSNPAGLVVTGIFMPENRGWGPSTSSSGIAR